MPGAALRVSTAARWQQGAQGLGGRPWAAVASWVSNGSSIGHESDGPEGGTEASTTGAAALGTAVDVLRAPLPEPQNGVGVQGVLQGVRPQGVRPQGVRPKESKDSHESPEGPPGIERVPGTLANSR